MTTEFDDAVAALFRAPHGEFVAARKRLGNELARAGDKPAAALFAKLPRPSISAWATNQLYWQAREEFEAFLASAARLRAGELGAAAEHRKQSNGLVNRAAALLKDGGHAASESTLRRIGANLAALAANGGFAPDPPGALKSDRDPPGFDAFALGGVPDAPARPRVETKRADGAEAEAARTRAQAEAERRRVAEEQARLRAERRELETALRTAKTAIERRTKERDRLKGELEAATSELERALASERELSDRLAKLPEA
ncbi:MAG TPA: hypothetical protein VMI54_07965 [Polyangiaceae bacterium]|nr:hypothetical protein [Polyangiaceae bacterium]